MKGNERIIERLNARLADELTAINQYIVHSEMCANWGYERPHEAIEKRAIEEMRHAEKLIARILFLEGKPIVSNLNRINTGFDVEGQHSNDRAAEDAAIEAYNEGIRLAAEFKDYLGFLISLGSSSTVATVVAGVVLTHTRAFDIGDRVRIADTVGDVVEKTLLRDGHQATIPEDYLSKTYTPPAFRVLPVDWPSGKRGEKTSPKE